MGVPRGNEEVGKIYFEGKRYGILTSPISHELYKKIYKIGMENGYSFTISGGNVHYDLRVEEKKLYLVGIVYKNFLPFRYKMAEYKEGKNYIQEITGHEKVFVDCFSGVIKAVLRSKDIGGDEHYIFDRDFLLITFKKGVVVKSEELHEVYRSPRRKLKNYIEE